MRKNALGGLCAASITSTIAGFLLMLVAFLLLPAFDRSAPLPAGCKVVRLSSQEVALEGSKYRAFIAGPGLARIGSNATLVLGEIELMPGRPSKLSDPPGCFILDPATEVIEQGITHGDWIRKLHAAGISGPPDLTAS